MIDSKLLISPSSFIHAIGDIPNLSSMVLSTDSRNLEVGSLFLALAGDNFDGFKFVESALKKGALGVIFEVFEVLGDLERSGRVLKAVLHGSWAVWQSS